ncbi:MAG: putative signal transducing protein [Gaiellaceae bacterium]
MEDEPVRVAVVPGEPEAEALCGLLRSDGIECGHRPTPEADSAFEGFGGEGGEQEILVHPRDLERAREILADVQP